MSTKLDSVIVKLDRITSKGRRDSYMNSTQDILVGKIFDFLIGRYENREEFVLFCSENGGVIRSCTPGVELADGIKLAAEDLSMLKEMLAWSDRVTGYLLFIGTSADDDTGYLDTFSDDMIRLMEIYETENAEKNFLLRALDFMDNPLCIYDRDAIFRYGNTAYCNVMNISDRKTAVGVHVNDLMKNSGTSIHALKSSSNKYKMFDVLENGRKVLDWEVTVESRSNSADTLSVSNNMYPILTDDDEIDGVLEFLYLNKLNLNKVNKIIGHAAEYTFDSIIGESEGIRQSIDIASEFATAGRNSVLIVGESGVGKELFAQAIHNYSNRSQEAFIALNCANFPENLFESELFGYVGGAFTGASKNGQLGKFELADGGTLFLDEIGEMPFYFQSKLLRVLETGKITRIGDTREIAIDVRVIAATNRDLERMVEEGLFRKDLYYRLQVLNLVIPPLREREDDIIPLAKVFLKQVAQSNGRLAKMLDYSAKKTLIEYNWPGNVRELRNVIQRVALLSKRNVINDKDIDASISSKPYSFKADAAETTEDRLEKCRREIEKANANLLKEALEMTNGNKQEAAVLLGMSRATFYRMMEKYLVFPPISE
ncbi:sigma-54 interaction domain-containing protein [Emergencia sp.]|uniref:sigma-54 interaction domain-containing protein n=1 Tax=Emergencia sp. TaxID=1926557 RepID=UPI003AF04E34